MSVRQIQCGAVKDKLAAGEPVHFVDVRQPEEYETARIGDSQHIPLGELTWRAGEVRPADGALVVVYCHHGVRSVAGAAMLHQAGLTNVASLAGGIDAWSVLVDPTVPRY